MTKIQCWVLETISGDERGLPSFVARFASRDAAEQASHHGDYPDYLKRVIPEEIVIFDSAVEWRPSLDLAARESGLAKLTPQERAALGL